MADDGVGLRQRAGAAGVAACVSAIVVNPLDVVKTRIQAQAYTGALDLARASAASNAASTSQSREASTSRGRPRGSGAATAPQGCPPRCPTIGNPSNVKRLLCAPECHVYESSFDVIRKIVRQEGALVLWRGTSR